MTQPTFSSQDVLIKAQETPNPYAVKFVVNQAIKNEGKATFQDKSEASNLPMISLILDIPGVRQVYAAQNTLTITHAGELPLNILKDQVASIVKTRLPIHNPDFLGPDEVEKPREVKDRTHLSPELQQIEEILDRTIRPGLQSDGGDVEVISFENNELKILYQGACGGCPSSMMGTLDAIQGIIGQETNNPDLRVVPI